MTAFESLKGGGQITEKEGEKATEAIARLQTTKTEQGYLDALHDLKNVVKIGQERAKRQAKMPNAQPTAATAPKRFKYNPQSGELE
jgi:NurA-like 5'-3' nuclease